MILIDKIDIVAGLGNPGPRYQNTYHNAGKLFLDFLSSNSEWTEKELFAFAKSKARSRDIFLVRPLVFMNESGQAIKAALKFLKVPSGKLLIAHDDADLPLGKFRISTGRGNAGHHGVESIQTALRKNDFARIRIGIRTRTGKAEEFVLDRITRKDRVLLQEAFGAASLKLNEKENP